MHIKQIIIQGFKSYRDQIVVEPLDKHHNAIIGPNGSGKSNFFHAIQFVLSDVSNLSFKQRLALLHESTAPRVKTAFVEIIFDNSDHRIPNEQDEIFLRRVIDSKTDDFFLNNELVSRSEVLNLLASAGLSNSNPYYIVQQNKINQLASAPNSYRLKLLKELACSKVYDERKEEIANILKDTVEKVEKINKFFQTIEERLKTLDGEKGEWKDFHKLDFIIHDTEHRENKRKLEELEKVKASTSKEQQHCDDMVGEAQDHAREDNRKIKETREDAAAAHEETNILSTEQERVVRDKTELELSIIDLTDDVKGDADSKEHTEAELKRLRQQILEKEHELEELKPKYEEIRAREEEFTRTLALNQKKKQELYAMQVRAAQFTSQQKRERWIEKKIKSLDKQMKNKRECEKSLREDLDSDAEKLADLKKKIEEASKEMERQRIAVSEHNKQYNECKKRKTREQKAKNEMWRHQRILLRNLSSLKEDLAKTDQTFCSMVGKPIVNGIDSVRKVIEKFKKRGGEWEKVATQYYGPVIENFTCNEVLSTVVEVTAGNRLFHHMVESDTVGIKILKEIHNQGLSGEVTFMPLNGLQVRDSICPNDDDVMSILKGLEYDPKYTKAMKYIFGKTLICRNLESANELAKQSHVDCVTLVGDQVSSNGFLTGYFTQSRSRLQTQKIRTEVIEQMKILNQELDILQQELNRTEANINTIVSEMQRAETKHGKAKNLFNKVKAEVSSMKKELASMEKFRRPKERSLALCETSLNIMQATKEEFELLLRDESMEQSTADQEKAGELKSQLDKGQNEEKESQDNITENAIGLEEMASEEVFLQEKIQESLDKIATLGTLPKILEPHPNYQKISLKQFFQQLKKANQHLKKYNHINKKALDKLISFSEQKEQFDKTKEELDDCGEKICELMKTLEHRKLEAITHTLKQVSENFTGVFKELMPQGQGKLIMRVKGEDKEVNLEQSNVDKISGVGIEVSFNGDKNVRVTNQLSGGQRTLVAFAFMFAMQKCDPSPFYFFDDIDQALDGQHRTAVARVVHELASSAQLVTSATRPELVLRAQRHYALQLRTRVSRLRAVTREHARRYTQAAAAV